MPERIDYHFNRDSYYVVGEDILTSGFASFIHHHDFAGLSHTEVAQRTPPLKFGRLFGKGPVLTEVEFSHMSSLLVRLGKEMSELTPDGLPHYPPLPPKPFPLPNDSSIPAGYTYLAQFLAHEITFDNLRVPPKSTYSPLNLRSPQIDLDSLYGNGPDWRDSQDLYDPTNVAKLKIGCTQPLPKAPREFWNDLPRDEVTRRALIADERNDENLAVAQLHVAFIKFHNYIVDLLQKNDCPPKDLFKHARKHLVRHFQWIILDDLLPKILDANSLRRVITDRARFFAQQTEHELFMPLEFSAAAFRFGHSMIRQNYEWNSYHSTQNYGVRAQLCQLLEQTEFSGQIGKDPDTLAITSDWVIDWRRFFDFSSLGYAPPATDKNMAGKMDRVFSLHLESIPHFHHHGLKNDERFITVRNLLRGLALSLPCGEVVAETMHEPVLTTDQLLSGPYETVRVALDRPEFKGNTPLWYYIMKEAELNDGEKLGPVGSRIVAETVVGLINSSRYSIFREPKWESVAKVLPEPSEVNFRMIDLLHLADVVNPIGN